jgi:hypothetical protein
LQGRNQLRNALTPIDLLAHPRSIAGEPKPEKCI